MNHSTNGFHGDILGLLQHICEQCLSLCLEKKGENTLIVLTLVWVTYPLAYGLLVRSWSTLGQREKPWHCKSLAALTEVVHWVCRDPKAGG